MKSLTTTARFTCRPALRARSAFGRIPAAITTISAPMLLPSLNATPSTFSFPRIAAVLRSKSTLTPRHSIFVLR